VLTNDILDYTAQLNLVVAQENEALSTVQLYGAHSEAASVGSSVVRADSVLNRFSGYC
jgi:hypothetical protein